MPCCLVGGRLLEALHTTLWSGCLTRHFSLDKCHSWQGFKGRKTGRNGKKEVK